MTLRGVRGFPRVPALGYDQLPGPLRRYVIAVTVAGFLVAPAVAAGAYRGIGDRLLLLALLAVFAAVAERYPIHLTHKTNVNLASAAYLAMIFTGPPLLAGVLALGAASAAQFAYGLADPAQEPPELLFNSAIAGLQVSAAAICFTIACPHNVGPMIADLGPVGAIAAASFVMHLVNTGLVSGAAGLQLGVPPFRVWWHNLSLDLLPQIALTVLALIAAVIAASEPLVLLLFAVPGVLIHRAVQQTIRLRVDTHEALASLVEVIELRDPYTAGHSRRVATSARLLALRLGLTAEEADLIESAGRVHDIGKAALDPAVLTKPGALSDDEWDHMRQHPALGANVVERFAAYQNGARLVRHHHERWDGLGYPDGLAGDAIPLGARILAVADAFDALTSDRPYRPGLDASRALAILREGSGVQWDEPVVAAFEALVREQPGDVPVAIRQEASSTVHSAGPARADQTAGDDPVMIGAAGHSGHDRGPR